MHRSLQLPSKSYRHPLYMEIEQGMTNLTPTKAADDLGSSVLLKAADDALTRLKGRHLSDTEQAVLLGAIADQTYEQIAEQSGYSVSYLKRDVGPKLWRILSSALGEDVSKTNFRGALQRYLATQTLQKQAPSRQESPALTPATMQANQPALEVPKNLLESLPAIETPARISDVLEPQLAQVPEGYVQRPPMEELCLETLRSPGSLIRIKAPTLFGKTSLLNWLIADLIGQGVQVASLSLKLAERDLHFTGLDKFLRWFCAHLRRELQLPTPLDECWDVEALGAKMSCSTYMEDCVLSHCDAPLVLCLDDVDLLFPYPAIYEDFFGLLRSWHEKAKTRPIWKKLRLALVYSTDVYIPLNINHSPFNVGLLVEPPEFHRGQAQELAQTLGLEASDALVDGWMGVVRGHPYLLEQAFAFMKTHPTADLTKTLAAASTDAGIYGNHLRRLWSTLKAHQELAIAFQKVVASEEPVQIAPLLAYQLQSLGLVEFVGNAVTTRLPLYRHYFSEHFRSHLP